jgi:phage shock protein A
MGVLSRVGDLFNANINDILDRCEDPEKMIKLLVEEMDQHITKAREALGKALAGEKRLEADLKRQRAAAAEWQAKAESALAGSNDDAARKCLLRKKEHESSADAMTVQWDSARKTTEALKADFQRLQQKAEEARRKRDTLIARKMAAEAQQHMATLGPSTSRVQRSFSKFDQMERKIESLEAEAQAMAELSYPADELHEDLERETREQAVDSELAALKAQMGLKTS